MSKKTYRLWYFQIKKYNNCIQLTVKSVTFFAEAKNAPLFTSADAGVIFLNLGYFKCGK